MHRFRFCFAVLTALVFVAPAWAADWPQWMGPERNGRLMCLEFATGKSMWDSACVGNGSLCVADGMLYVRGQNGNVALVEATPAGYKEHGRFSQPDRGKRPAWPYPVVANGCLYLRDLGVLLCYDVRDPDAGK